MQYYFSFLKSDQINSIVRNEIDTMENNLTNYILRIIYTMGSLRWIQLLNGLTLYSALL